MKKKSQIRKYSVEKVFQLTQTQTIPEMLKLYAEHVSDKKNKLIQKKQELINHLNSIRKKSEKIVYQMADGIKDRIEKTEKIVMTADSRPTQEDIKVLSDLFTYMQTQTNMIHRNSKQSHTLQELLLQLNENTINNPADFTILDNEFEVLRKKCEQQQKERDFLSSQMNKNRQFYMNIRSTIQQYRVKYDIIEGHIAEREKYLDHLVSYFKTRQNEDSQKIQNELRTGNELESQIIKAQQVLNISEDNNRKLVIQQNEYTSRKHQQ